MGFYGNITNTSRTQFVFDKVYSSRYEMDFNCAKDGVYAGRYVLVEYEVDTSEDIYKKNFYCVDGEMYTQLDTSHGMNIYSGPIESSKVNAIDVKDGDIAWIKAGKYLTKPNKETEYIKITNATQGTFEDITADEYNSYWLAAGGNFPDLDDPASLHAHIVNGAIVNKSNNMTNGMCLAVPPYFRYNASFVDTYWMATIFDEENLVWSQINSSGTNFLKNFNIDNTRYGVSRGYDSTVWQKVYSSTPDGTEGSPNKGRYEKYVMIAELNTVVPTFDICADAPSIVPIAPHFDGNSTNIYYRFHWQPQWGFRTKAASPLLYGPEIQSNGSIGEISSVKLTSDKTYYPSDQKTSWHTEFYNSNTDKHSEGYYNFKDKKWDKDNESPFTSFDAAIYYNKAGFKPDIITYSSDILDPYKPAYDGDISSTGWTDEDKIAIEPSGLSGNVYNPHNGFVDPTPQKDTQELSIMLPSLGNAVAAMWDIVYGGRDTNDEIGTKHQRNLDIAWEDAALAPERKGLRLVNNAEDGNGYELTDIEANTLAGCINSVHDLMGMIIVDDSDEHVTDSNIGNIDSDAIYYYPNSNTFKRRHEGFEYTELEYDYLLDTSVDARTYNPGYYYLDNKGATVADGEFQEGTQYYKKVLKNINQLYKPITLNGYEKGCYYNTLGGEWRYENSDSPLEGITYYRHNPDRDVEVELNGEYHPYEVFSWSEKNKEYTLSTSEQAVTGEKYYKIPEEDVKQVNLNMEESGWYDKDSGLYGPDPDNQKPLVYLYSPERFYYKEVNNKGEETGNYIRENRQVSELQWNDDGTLNTTQQITITHDDGTTEIKQYDREYYFLDAKTASQTQDIIQKDENGNLIHIQQITGNVTIYGIYKVTLLKFEEGKYYYVNGTEDLPPDEYGVIETVNSKYALLTASMLASHYDEQFIDTDDGKIPMFVKYYTLKVVKQGTFYTKNTFWYQTNDLNFVRDKNDVITVGRKYYESLSFSPIQVTYYMPNKYYIYDETEGLYIIDTRKEFVAEPHYTRHDVFVLSDTLNIYPRGSVWNIKVGTIPASVRLAFRETKWEMQELVGFARTLNTIHGLIMRINKLVEFNDLETRDSNTLQGAINILNDYIDKFQEMNPRDIVVVDSYGRLHSAPWTTHQQFSTTNMQTSHANEHNEKTYERIELNNITYIPLKYYYYPQGSSTLKLDDSRQFTAGREYWREVEDTWIKLDVNADPRKPEITLQHRFNAVPDTVTVSDKNIALTAAQANNFRGNNNTAGDTLQLYTPIIDAQGHVVGKNTESVTLPFGFKILKAENSSDSDNKWSQVAGATSSTGESVYDIVADNTQDTLTFKGGNKWIRFKTDATKSSNTNSKTSPDGNNIFTIAHETHDFDTTSAGTTNLNTEAGAADEHNITIPDWDYDLAGHIVSKKSHTYTLPFGFKTIKTNGRSATASGDNTGAPTTTNIVADTTQDILSIDSGNKWIRIDTDTANDKIIISHDIHTPTLTAKNPSDINGNGDTITIQDITFDNAGHMTANQNHTYTLPYSFKFLNTIGTSTATSADLYTTRNAGSATEAPSDVKAVPEGSTTAQADNTQDTLSINPANKWIQVKLTDVNNVDMLQFAHEIHSVNVTTANATDINTLTGNSASQITLQDMEFDAAGHIIGNHSHTYTLPYGFKTITTNGVASNEKGIVSASGTTNVVADNSQDSLAINSGNMWIKLHTDANNDTITISHTAPDTTIANLTKTVVGTETGYSLTPAFGSNFVIPEISYDKTGHISSISSHAVTIPKGKLIQTTAKTNGNVLTTISFTDTTGEIVVDRTNLGALELGTYTAPTGIKTNANTSINASNLTTTSTLATAINTLDARIMAEEKARADAIDALDVSDLTNITGKILTNIKQENGKITATNTNLVEIALSNYSKGTARTAIETTDSLGAGIGKLECRLDLLEADSSTTGSIKEQISTAIAGVVDGADGAFDTLKEIANWINDSDSAKTGFNAAKRITDLEGKPGFGITSEQINNWNAAEPNDENTVLTTTEFIYKEADGETPEEKVTIQSLIAKVKDLEAEILILKSKHPEETTP